MHDLNEFRCRELFRKHKVKLAPVFVAQKLELFAKESCKEKVVYARINNSNSKLGFVKEAN